MIFLINFTETWIENSISNRIFDPQYNLSILENKKIFSTSINFWLIDSKVYSIFLGYKDFGFNLRYYDFGKFDYQGEFVNDFQNLTFSPFSIYASIGKRFKIEKDLYFAFNFGYFENRIFDQVFASPFVSISSNLKIFKNIRFLFSIENFSFKKLFSANQIELPTIISIASLINLKNFNIGFGANKYYKYERFLSMDYKLKSLNFGILYTPDYDYSKISAFVKVKYKNLYLGYRAFIPNYLNFTNVIMISYEAP